MGVITSHTTVIDGIGYTTKTLPATEGLALLPRLIRLAGDKAMTLLMGVDSGDVDALLSEGEVVAALLVGMAERASDDDDGWTIARQILKYTTADKVRIGEAEIPGSVAEHFDTHFAARYQHLLEVCVWAARVGFGGPSSVSS
jgi:hypothetical protein